MLIAPLTIGVSFKTYFSNARAHDWLSTVADRAAGHPAVADGTVDLFVIPTYLQIPAALDAFAGTPVRVGAQDVSQYEPGPYTGEVTAAELAEIGVALAEIGHTERRRLLGDTEQVVAAKTAAALSHGLTPVLCIGEHDRSADAPVVALTQLRDALRDAPDGPVIVAYEPVWAIGGPAPAPPAHIAAVTGALRAELAARPGSTIVYGGSAGPGLLTRLGDHVDGLFLGRFAHDPAQLGAVLDEAAAIATRRRS